MISNELYRARISGWGGRARFPLPQCPAIRKSAICIDILWRISTRLQANTISALLMIGGIEINPGPGSTTEEEICPMEIEECSHPDVFTFSSQTVQHTPISSQVVPLDALDLSSHCSDVPMTPEKGISTPKSRKRKGYLARKDRSRAAIKKRRSDDSEFCNAENESRLERFKKDCEDPDFLAKHNENHLRDITKRLKDPKKRAEHNNAVAERLNHPEKRAEHNNAVAERLNHPEKRAEHNNAVAERLNDPEKRAEHNNAVAERLNHPEKRAEHNNAVAERLNHPEKRAEHNNAVAERLNHPKKRAEHNNAVAERLNHPGKRAEHNNAVAERLKDSEKRAKHNNAVAERLKDPDVREKHNKHVLEKYRTNRDEVSSVIQSYFSQISQGPTYVCSCCGCLHFRKTVVMLNREKLVSTNVSNPDFFKQVIILFTLNFMRIIF